MAVPISDEDPSVLSTETNCLSNISSEVTAMLVSNEADDTVFKNELHSSSQSPSVQGVVGSFLDWLKFEEQDGSFFPSPSHEFDMLPSRFDSNSPLPLYRPITSTDTPISTPRRFPAALNGGSLFLPNGLDDNSSLMEAQIKADPVLNRYPPLYEGDEPLAHFKVCQSINPTSLAELQFYSHTASPYSSEADHSFVETREFDQYDDHTSLDNQSMSQRSVPNGDRIPKSENYATLLFQCLLAAPDHMKELREIYQWFEVYTEKATNMKDGWRNSVRHNLSMNDAFESVKRPNEESSNKHWWRLTEKALHEGGVEPTTRFRNKTGKARRGGHSGRVTKIGVQHDVRRSTRLNNNRERDIPFRGRQQQLMNSLGHEITSNPDLSRENTRYSSLPPFMAHPGHPFGYTSSPYSGHGPDKYDFMPYPAPHGLQRPGSEPPLGDMFDAVDSPMSPASNHISQYRSPRSTDEPLTPATILNEEAIFAELKLPHNDYELNLEHDFEADKLYAWPMTS